MSDDKKIWYVFCAADLPRLVSIGYLRVSWVLLCGREVCTRGLLSL